MSLIKYYRDNPPLHIMVKAYLSGGKEEPKENEVSFDDFFREVNGG